MTHEISNTNLYDLMCHRADRNTLDRAAKVNRSVERILEAPLRYPDGSGNYIIPRCWTACKIVFHGFGKAIHESNRFDQQLDRLKAGVLRDLDRMGDVVQHKLRGGGLQEARPSHTDKRSVPDGQREAAQRQCYDMRAVDRREKREAAEARWTGCENYKCPEWGWDNHDLCMDRQWAGICPALARCGGGPDAKSHA